MITLSSLGATRDPELLKRHLAFSITDEVRQQDIIYVIGPVASNPAGRKLAWEFVQANWQTFYDRYYHGGMSLLGRVVSSSTGDFSSAKWLAEVEAFFGTRDIPKRALIFILIHLFLCFCRFEGPVGHRPLHPAEHRAHQDADGVAGARPRRRVQVPEGQGLLRCPSSAIDLNHMCI